MYEYINYSELRVDLHIQVVELIFILGSWQNKLANFYKHRLGFYFLQQS